MFSPAVEKPVGSAGHCSKRTKLLDSVFASDYDSSVRAELQLEHIPIFLLQVWQGQVRFASQQVNMSKYGQWKTWPLNKDGELA